MMRPLLPALALLAAGCAAPSAPYTAVRQSSPVRPAAADQVAQCRYLDDIVGTSGWYGIFATQGIENARAEAFAKAESIGATHIVWQPRTEVFGSTSIAGKAYRCP